jgi:hypothetical protein
MRRLVAEHFNPTLWEPNGGHAIGGMFGHDDAKQKCICFKHDAVIDCLQHFFVEIIDIVTPADVDFLTWSKVQLAVNLERIALRDCELVANEAHVNHSTSSSSKVAHFVFNAFL